MSGIFGLCFTPDCWKTKFEQECRQEIDSKTANMMGPPPPQHILDQMYTDCINNKMIDHQKKSDKKNEMLGDFFSVASGLFGKKDTPVTTTTPGVSVELPRWAKAGIVLLGVAVVAGIGVIIYKAAKN